MIGTHCFKFPTQALYHLNDIGRGGQMSAFYCVVVDRPFLLYLVKTTLFCEHIWDFLTLCVGPNKFHSPSLPPPALIQQLACYCCQSQCVRALTTHSSSKVLKSAENKFTWCAFTNSVQAIFSRFQLISLSGLDPLHIQKLLNCGKNIIDRSISRIC